jgi:predicted regulator of Ras-like GTPase activity (Roadblock/LC7/MglB family)
MKISFLDFFRKATSRRAQTSAKSGGAGSGARRVEKPSDQKLSKTVLPNATRSSSATDPFKAASLPPSIRVSPAPAPTISLKRDLPPAVALALQPRVERAISLELSDVLEQVPAGYVKPSGTFDSSRRVQLKASEIEKGMAEGKPTVSLASIYEQVPEIFLHSVPSGEMVHVALPYAKVLEQINSVHVRADQVSDQAVPQVETPILQVTMEDKDRFGTAIEPPQTSPLPPVKVEPATAKAISTAEPEPAVTEKIAPAQLTPLGFPLSTGPQVKAPEPPPPAAAAPATPTRIPFSVPPNGMGGSASERVPASSGPPIPTGAAKTPTSARIPFRVAPPCDDLRPKLTLVPGVETPEKAIEVPERSDEPSAAEATSIELTLRAIMQNLPAFQLNGNAESIPADVRLTFPLSLVKPQLSTGRVAIEAKTFQAALPQPYRDFFIIDSSETPVLLPLQEILKNLPTTALKMRDDQEEVEAGGSFETPFSIKAKEDEQRFKVSGTPVPKGDAAIASDVGGASSREPEISRSPASAASQSSALRLSMTEVSSETPGKDKHEEATPPERAAVTAAKQRPGFQKADATGALAKWMEAGAAQAAQKSAAEEAPVDKAAPSAAPIPTEATPAENEPEVKPLPTLDIKGRKEKNEAKELVARANALPGVGGCCLTFADGLGLAGNLPSEAAAEGLCAMAPSVFGRIEKHLLDTKLGSLTAVTLHCTKAPVTFFMQGNICLTVLHNDGNLPLETQNQLAKMTKELSRTYSQPEMADVDH